MVVDPKLNAALTDVAPSAAVTFDHERLQHIQRFRDEVLLRVFQKDLAQDLRPSSSKL